MRFLSFKFWPVVQIDHKSSHLAHLAQVSINMERKERKTTRKTRREYQRCMLEERGQNDTSLVGFGRARALVRLHGVIDRRSALEERGLW